MIVLWQDGIERWEPNRFSASLPIEETNVSVQDFAVSPAGQIVAGAASDGTVKLWDVKTQQVTSVLKMRLSPEEEKQPDLGPPIDVGSYTAGERVVEGMARVAFIADAVVVALHTRGKMCVWDIHLSDPLFCVDGPRGRRLGLVPAPTGNRVLVWGEDSLFLGGPRVIGLPFEMRQPSELRRVISEVPADASGPL